MKRPNCTVTFANSVETMYRVSILANKRDHLFKLKSPGELYKVCTYEKTGRWVTSPTTFRAPNHPTTGIIHEQRAGLVHRANERRRLARNGQKKFNKWEMDDLKDDMAAYYRYCLLRNLDKRVDNVVPMEMHHHFVRAAVDAARDTFYDAHDVAIENRKVSPFVNQSETRKPTPIDETPVATQKLANNGAPKIGRASCRERV